MSIIKEKVIGGCFLMIQCKGNCVRLTASRMFTQNGGGGGRKSNDSTHIDGDDRVSSSQKSGAGRRRTVKGRKNGGLESRYFLIGYDTESDISSNYILTIVVVFSFFLLWKTLAFPFFVKFARDKCSDVE